MKKIKPAIFLDRDGTLNVEKNYVHRIEDWEWIPGAVHAVREFNRMGFLVIVVSNQAGIARGLYKKADVYRLHRQINDMLRRKNAHIDGFYFCPHHPDYSRSSRQCRCRKPAPGLILKAQKDYSIDLSRSYMVGDKAIDVEMGRAAGVKRILVRTGYGRKQSRGLSKDVSVLDDVLSAMKWIRKDIRKISAAARSAKNQVAR